MSCFLDNTSTQPNWLNQYGSIQPAGQSPYDLDYDASGNLTNDGSFVYTYDPENRLLTVVQGATPIAIYTYDAMERRISKYIDETDSTTTYVYNRSQVIAEYEDDGIIGPVLARKFIYGPWIDEPVCMMIPSGRTNAGLYFYFFDGLGSVVALVNSSGNIVERYEYEAYGKVTIGNADFSQTFTKSQYGNPFMFTGRYYDDESGLYYCRARMYSPALGRFLQTDPVGYADSMNLYQYCGNNPVNWIDPWGLCKEDAVTIDAQAWEEYLQGVYDDVQELSPVWYHVLWAIRAGYFDTELNGSNLYIDEKAKHALYYIEPLDRYVYGWEINYVGQGMLYERFVIIPGLDNVYAHTMPFTWKIINAWQKDYKVKDDFNKNMHIMTPLGKREYSRIRKEKEKGR